MTNPPTAKLLSLAALALLVIATASQFTNPGCSTFDANQNCLVCKNSFYLYAGFCLPVSPLCLTYNTANGNCLSCYPGFALANGLCTPAPTASASTASTATASTAPISSTASTPQTTSTVIYSTPMLTTTTPSLTTASAPAPAVKTASTPAPIANCAQTSLTGCIQCQASFYLKSPLQCAAVSPLCQTYNQTTGQCYSCIAPYIFSQLGSTCSKPIPNCLTQTAATCNICSPSFMLISNNSCQPINPQCVSYQDAVCQACYTGSVMINGNCFYQIDSCSSYDSNGNCLTCANGYVLNGNECEAVPVFVDPNCRTFNASLCVKCSYGYFFNPQSVCTQVSTLCMTFDSNSGNCLSCYTGYTLNASVCVLSAGQYDPNCNKFAGTVCTQCSTGFSFDANNSCTIPNDPQCKSYNSNSICVQCYTGYLLGSDAICTVQTTFNCYQYSANNTCVKCANGFYLANGICVQVDALCANFDYNTQACTGCYLGYMLYQGSCTLLAMLPATVPQPNANCAKMVAGKCVACYNRSYLNVQGLCLNVSDYCKTYNPNNGNCTTCYPGYSLVKGACIAK